PSIVIIELGGNDGLRGFSLKEIRANLARMIDLCHQNNHKVLLVGMQLPPNYGIAYTKQFSGIFRTLATEKKTALVPFLFNGFADKKEYFQADQIHPNAKAQKLLLDNIWPALQPLL
ncbi:MAG: arylesterase, partial [Gammaproteobacteria bacterium]|nr:arylesterase [Gammaproteobacteria bacterium]